MTKSKNSSIFYSRSHNHIDIFFYHLAVYKALSIINSRFWLLLLSPGSSCTILLSLLLTCSLRITQPHGSSFRSLNKPFYLYHRNLLLLPHGSLLLPPLHFPQPFHLGTLSLLYRFYFQLSFPRKFSLTSQQIRFLCSAWFFWPRISTTAIISVAITYSIYFIYLEWLFN